MPAATAPASPSSEDAAAKPAGRAKAGRRRWPLLVFAVVLLSAAGGGGWWWFQSRSVAAQAAEAAAAPARKPARYHALEPSFVVNLADQDAVRYLQVDVQLVTRDDDTLAAFEAHAPALRNRLLLLFGQQSSAQLAQRSGKERLQEAARDEVRGLLRGEGAANRVEAVIFTSLVTQ